MSQAFESVIRLQLSKFSPEEAKRRHIAIARKGLAAFLAGQETKPAVLIETDGTLAASEDSVRPYGVITYRFTRLREIVRFALAEARRLSPHRSGRYAGAWFAMVGDREVDPEAVAGDVTVVIANDQPYARKIHVGASGFERYVPPGIVEKVKELVRRRYGSLVDVRVDFVQLAGGYVLKGRQRSSSRKALADWHGVPEPVIDAWRRQGKRLGSVDLRRRLAAQDRRSSAFRQGRQFLAGRKDTAEGQPMTYPALVIQPKFKGR